MTAIILQDHYSKGKDNRLYAKKGDKVKVIARYDKVLIVELKELFPIHENKVKLHKT